MHPDSLTTEQLRRKFKNNFDLCNFSIQIARSSVRSGHSAALRDLLETVEDRAEDREDEAFAAR